MPQSQPTNSSQVDGLSSQFQRRWESTYHWRSMCSMLLGTPGLRAAWPMSSIDVGNPLCRDIAGGGYHLTMNVGGVPFGRDPNGIAPLANFGGAANQYLSRASALGAWATITGGEAHIQAADRGLTVGGWFWWSALPGAGEVIMAKADGGANLSYMLNIGATNQIFFAVWAGPISANSAATINAGWNHCVGIYDQASQTVFVELNGVITSGAAGAAPALVADTAAPFTIGADGAGANLFTGYASDCFLAATSLSQGFVKAGYHYTKAAYGVK